MDVPHGCAPPDDGGSPVSEAFRAFTRAMMLHRRVAMIAFAEQEIHHAQAGCLRIVTARDGLSQADLADALHVSRPTVTSMLQKMEAAGTIERRDDAHDSRITRVYATAEGRQVAEQLDTVHRELIASTFGTFSEVELVEFKRLLDTLAEREQQVLEARGGAGIPMHHHTHHHGVEEAR